MQDFKTLQTSRSPWLGRCALFPYPLGHKIFWGPAVTAGALLKRAADSGVVLYLDSGTLKARGCREAVGTLAPELRAHKAELLALLTREAVNDPCPAPKKALTQVRPTTSFDVSAEWRALDVAYQAHHLQCPVCVAAGKGYGMRCGAGAALWRAYAEHQPRDTDPTAPP